jgi:hypothetical protein
VRSKLRRLEQAARGHLASFGLEDGSRFYYDPTSAEMGMAPGSRSYSEYEVQLNDLVRDGHLEPHPERTPTDSQRYLITDRGIAAVDEREPRSSTPGQQEGSERPWWRRVFGG